MGILMVDFVRDTVGLHVNGTARLMEPAAAGQVGLQARSPAGRGVRVWVVVDVEQAYIHCSKHIPRLPELLPDPPQQRILRRPAGFNRRGCLKIREGVVDVRTPALPDASPSVSVPDRSRFSW